MSEVAIVKLDLLAAIDMHWQRYSMTIEFDVFEIVIAMSCWCCYRLRVYSKNLCLLLLLHIITSCLSQLLIAGFHFANVNF